MFDTRSINYSRISSKLNDLFLYTYVLPYGYCAGAAYLLGNLSWTPLYNLKILASPNSAKPTKLFMNLKHIYTRLLWLRHALDAPERVSALENPVGVVFDERHVVPTPASSIYLNVDRKKKAHIGEPALALAQ